MQAIDVLNDHSPFGDAPLLRSLFSVARWRRGATALTSEEMMQTDELVVERDRVVWRTLGDTMPKRSYKTDFAVVQAVVCTFPAMHARASGGASAAAADSPPPPLCVCLLRADDIITIYAADGRLFEVKQPCRIKRMWPMESGDGAGACVGGLMLARDPATGSDGGVLFSLTHPLEEMRPLSFVGGGESSSDAEEEYGDVDLHTNYFCDARDEVVWVDSDGDGAVPNADADADADGCSSRRHWPSVATWHAEKRRLALWRVERLPTQGDAWTAPVLASHLCMRLVALEKSGATPHRPLQLFTISGDETHVGRLLCVQQPQRQTDRRLRALLLPAALDAGHPHLAAPPLALSDACTYENVLAAVAVQTSCEDTLGSTSRHARPTRLLLTVGAERCDLHLYRGAHSFASSPFTENGRAIKVAALRHSVGSCVTVVLEDQRAFRCAVRPAPDATQSELLVACIDAADVALASGLFAPDAAVDASNATQLALDFRSDVLTALAESGDDDGGAASSSASPPRDDARGPTRSWGAFLRVLADAVGDDAGGAGASASVSASVDVSAASPPMPPTEPIDAWSAMMCSDFHSQFAQRNRAVDAQLGGTAAVAAAAFASPVSVSAAAASRRARPAGRRTSAAMFRAVLPQLFLSWHTLYEELKLARLKWRHLLPLARLLSALVSGWTGVLAHAFNDLYSRDHGAAMALTSGLHCAELQRIAARVRAETAIAIPPLARLVAAPPNVMRWIVAVCAALSSSDAGAAVIAAPSLLTTGTPFPWIDAMRARSGFSFGVAGRLFRRTRLLCSYFSLLLSGGGTARDRAEAVVLQMVRDGFTRAQLDLLPFGIGVPLRETLRLCCPSPPGDWSAAALQLVERDDVAELVAERGDGTAESALQRTAPRPPLLQPQRSSTVGGVGGSAAAGAAGAAGLDRGRGGVAAALSSEKEAKVKPSSTSSDLAGLEWVQAVSKLTFSRDRRLQEVCRLLDSSRQMRLPPLADYDQLDDQARSARNQEDLITMCRRARALPVGRGMLTISLSEPISTETQPIPPLTLSAISSPNETTVKLDTAEQAKELNNMARFHNGAAAALRLSPHQSDVTRTWVLYNQTADQSSEAVFEHAGFLMGLGLHGHLKVLNRADFVRYLAPRKNATTVGLLLGLAAGQRGSAHLYIYKMLALFLPSLLGEACQYDPLPSPMVQTAAILGVGLLYQETPNRDIIKYLLTQIGQSPTTSDVSAKIDSECYSLSAGLALGLVTLGCGRKSKGDSLADLSIASHLHRYIIGVSDASGKLVGGKGRNAGPQTHPAATGGHVHRTGTINIAVTSPGAILALAMMYLKSNNEDVVKQLAVPETLFLLDYVRPDLLLLRVLCRSLVLWDSVQPTVEWVESHVPIMLAACVERLRMAAPPLPGLPGDSSTDSDDSDSGARPSNVVEVLVPATADAPARKVAVVVPVSVDWDLVRQAHANIIAGACSALGYRYAGTADAVAVRTIILWLHRFMAMRACGGGGGSKTVAGGTVRVERKGRHRWQRPDTATLEFCLGACSIALGMVLAGRGSLVALRLLREIRAKTNKSVTYGHHMAYSTAIGLLFLGGGRATLKRSDDAIAAMLCSFYPRFPFHAVDNQYHLQPLRHLYALAVDYRFLQTFDVGQGDGRARDGNGSGLELSNLEECSVPITIALKESKSYSRSVMKLTTPCVLPELELIESISTDSVRYWPLVLDVDRIPSHARAMKSGWILVKRRCVRARVWCERGGRRKSGRAN